jgi:hypothetical protein
VSRDILRLDILRRDQAVLDELQGRWPRAYKVDYGDFEIPAFSRLEAEGIARAVYERLQHLCARSSAGWTVEIEEADKRLFLVGGERHEYSCSSPPPGSRSPTTGKPSAST